jgi:LmbE family N-acetylglucosaminyl deacetylase
MKSYSKIDFLKKRKLIFTLLVALFLSISGWLVYSRYTQVLPQSAIYFLDDVVMPKAGEKVLVFSPHPDDETIGVGGYIYDCEKAGAEVRVILVTDGNKHNLKEKRYGEFRKATGILGVAENDLVFLNHPDGRLKQENKQVLLSEFKSNLEFFKPDIVLYTSPKDTHEDHATTGRIAEEVLKENSYKKFSFEFFVHHNHFPQPKRYKPDLFLLPPLSLVTFDQEWQRHMLSRETEDKKKEAVFVYKSQLKTPFLRSLILSSIRKNELFLRREPND